VAAWAAFFAGVGLLGMLDVSPLVAFAIAVLSLELSRLLVRAPGENGPPALPMPWWTCRRAHCPHCCSSSP
jgi:hypothetical protein